MKKFGSKIALILMLSLIVGTQTATAAFSDISSSHKYYQAISYLKENDILHGYSDGTFRAEAPVNRAEFLKIILEGSTVNLDISSNTNFSDVDHDAWYGPYVKKAFFEGWINGYPDGTFKPEQTINKVEALKILGEVQDWNFTTFTVAPFSDTPISAWYTKYVNYAKTNNYLEETGSTFEPANLMTRGSISEIIYRTLTNDSESTAPENDNEDDIPINNDNTVELNTDPEAFSPISKLFFNDISLNENLPNIFYKNEVYYIKGDITSGSHTTATIFLDPIDSNPENYITFSGKVSNNHFEIPVFFMESGNFNIGILPGNNGTTKLEKISVMSLLPTFKNSSVAPTTTNLSINFEDDSTFVNFSTSAPSLKKAHFIQNNRQITYISRQDLNHIPVQYKDFEFFKEGTINYYLETAAISAEKPLTINSGFQSTAAQNFKATEHSFDYIDNEKINSSPPDLMNSIQTINFSGQVNTESQLLAYITKPDGHVETKNLSTISPTKTYFGETTIDAGSDFQFTYTPAQNGRYILEINDKDGLPILNHPVYIGGTIPLIPDYFDLHVREFSTDNFNLSTLRNQLIELINESRLEHGIPIITLSEELNNLAQDHAEDMSKNDYFSHINLENQTPEDRRIEAGIATPVSENIARDVSVQFAHFGLMRSGSHRDNLLNENWTKIGIGIAKNSKGYLLITEEFSPDLPTAAELQQMENEAYAAINVLRNSNNLTPLTTTNNLENTATYLNDEVIDNNATLDQNLFNQALSQNNISGFSEALGRTFNIWSDILDSIITEATILDPNWKSYGINVQNGNTGILHTILILNKP